MCAQEEERIKSSQGESAHFVKDNKRKNFNGKNSKPQEKPKWDKASSSNSQGKKPQDSENQQYGGAEKISASTASRRDTTRGIVQTS